MNRKQTFLVAVAVLALTVGLLARGVQANGEQKAPAPAPPAVPATPYLPMSGGGSYLGVDISEVTSERVGPLKLKEERGVEITMVDQDAPAGKAGLKEHDVILDFNGARVEGEEQLRRMLRETPAGRAVTLGISRDGQPMQISVTLGSRAKMMAPKIAKMRTMRIDPPNIVMPDIEIPAFEVSVRSYSRRTGMMVDNLTPQLGEFFGVKPGIGVLVRSVEKGSAAEAAGLRAGDVITKVDDEQISDRNDWSRALRKKGGKVNFVIVRDKKEQSLTVTLPEKKPEETGRNFFGVSDPDVDFDMESFGEDQWEDNAREMRLRLERIMPKIAEQQAKLASAFSADRAQLEEKMFMARDKATAKIDSHRHQLDNARQELEHILEQQRVLSGRNFI